MSYAKCPLQMTKEDEEVLLSWWDWLESNRGDRAQLRRASSPDEVLTMAAFSNFLSHADKYRKHLSEDWSKSGEHLYASALVCGLLSQVKSLSTVKTCLTEEDDNSRAKLASFAEQLATPKPSQARSAMSEIRFQRLQQSRNVEEFYLNMSRAIDLLDGQVNIPSMVADILGWYREFYFGKERQPSKRLSVRWATDYFKTLNQKNLA